MFFKSDRDHITKERDGEVRSAVNNEKLLAALEAFIDSRYEEPEEALADNLIVGKVDESTVCEDAAFGDAVFSDDSFSDAAFSDAAFGEAPEMPYIGGAPETSYRRDKEAYSEAAMPPSSAFRKERKYEAPRPKFSYAKTGKPQKSLQDVMKNVGENFREMLLRMIDERGLSDPYVYKRANLDRKLFSKIRCNKDYCPSKKTVLALAIALKLSLDETIDLLSRAGYALSPCSKTDLIVEFCIINEIFDIYEVNDLLFKYGEPTLG